MNSSTERIEQGTSCEFKENLNFLREIRFFSELSLQAIKVFAYLCTRETYKAGDILFHQKDDDGRAFFIISGEARLGHQDEKKLRVVREISAGVFLGGLALLGKAPRLFSLQAITDMNCLIMTREKFSKVAEQFPDIMPRVLRAVVDSVHVWEETFLAKTNENCENCMRKIGVSLI